ncbi:hypothetical protein [Flavobacterium sp.]|uniref:hypothetical protein n=1 Tax=Flavobacterium sp. TaxID=239 RepID=UPI00260303BF|nr:hypothetical protein [Flavobacterium sp.]
MLKKLIPVLLLFVFTSCKDEKQKLKEYKATDIDEVKQKKTVIQDVLQDSNVKKKLTEFIPEGYVIHKYEGGISAEGWDEIKGDLNQDGTEDIVLIIKGTDKEKIIQHESRGELDQNRRGILVLFKKDNYYKLVTANYDCFSSENEDGGVYFAPELNVEIIKGNLNISYGHGRYGRWNYTFAYRNGDMELIGYDLYSSRGPIPQYEISINFLTKKKLKRDNINKDDEGDNYEVKYVDSWENIRIKNRIKLGEIKDFDELDF